MRIKKLVIKNYRQLRDLSISFPKNGVNDLHVFIGDNGAGKTNILNAINWCLYHEEPHLSKNSQTLPTLNLQTEKETQNGKVKVFVELIVDIGDERDIRFIREEEYRVENGKSYVLDRSFKVKEMTEDFSYRVYKDEEANNRVNRFVPKRIREFFFFDNERLDSYFKEATAKNIRSAVFDISQLDVLERIEERLSVMGNDIRREAGKKNPKIDDIRRKLEEEEEDLKNINNQINSINEQIHDAKKEIQEIQEELRGIPDVEALQKEREELEKVKADKVKLRQEKVKEKNEIIYRLAKIIYVWPNLKKTLGEIEDKRGQGALPPPVDRELLKNILEKNSCEICNRHLTNEAKERVLGLLDQIEMSNEVSHLLNNTGQQIKNMEESLPDYLKRLEMANKDFQSIETEINQKQERINEIGKELNKAEDLERVVSRNSELNKLEEELPNFYEKKGRLNNSKNEIENRINKIKNDLEKEYKKEKQHKELVDQIKYSEKLLEIAKTCKKKIMEETKQEIENATKKLYFDLLWKKETFADVKIDDNYNINLIHVSGYECLGSVSAAERALLALSFTLALHQISGFDAPVLVDTPVSRTSGKHRENFASTFCDISENKQAILLFTPDEYSDNISRFLNAKASNRFKFKVIKKEIESELEVL